VDQCACNRCTLSFSSGKLSGVLVSMLFKSSFFEGFHCELFDKFLGVSADFECECDVFEDCFLWKEFVVLENHSHSAAILLQF